MKRLLRALVTALLVPVLLFEEWGWAPLAAAVARLGRLPLWAALEARIRALPPWAALLTFLTPIVLLLPVKLAALWLFGLGHAASGLGLLIGAKLVGTAIVARLFQLTEPTLMRIGFFGRWYPRWKGWKNAVLSRVRASRAWRQLRAWRRGVRRFWRGLLSLS